MIIYRTTLEVTRLCDKDIYEFLLYCTDEQYQHWWPGTHLAWHTLERTPSNVGNLVYMDEYVGDFRLKFRWMVKQLVPYQEIVWQMREFGVLWPVCLSLKFSNTATGVNIIHTVSAGFHGIGRFLDVFLRFYLSPRFEQQMAAHAQTEFNKLRDLLRQPETVAPGQR